MIRLLTITIATFLICFAPRCVRAEIPERWFYAYVDLANETLREGDTTNYTTDRLLELLPRLYAEGYTVVVLADYNIQSREYLRADTTAPRGITLQKNLSRIADAARQLGIEIIPEVMPVGSSGSILQNDPNLAEGTPVFDCMYRVVRDRSGKLIADVDDSSNQLSHGALDKTQKEVFAAWGIAEDDLIAELSDETPTGTGTSLGLVFQDSGHPDGTNFEFGQQGISLQPWQQYRLSFRIKTSELKPKDSSQLNPHFYAEVTGRGPVHSWRPLEHVNRVITKNRGWDGDESHTEDDYYVITFNSYTCVEAKLFLGFLGIQSGSAWIDDVVLQRVGGVNLLRRDDDVRTSEMNEGLPITVKSQDGSVKYVECQDFQKWEDESVGIGGGYLHTQPSKAIEICNNSRIMEGQRLMVSYYHATLANVESHRVCCSLRHPKMLGLFRFQVERLNEILDPKRWAINHDEIRSMGHDPLSKGHSPHRILGENLQACTAIVRDVDADDQIMLFSDMYDPFHNAVPTTSEHSLYPLVNGSFTRSWDYIPNGTTIWNWSLGEASNFEDVRKEVEGSFQHFQILGCDQVVGGFYDVKPGATDEDRRRFVRERAEYQFSIAKEQGRITGVCYYSTKRDDEYTALFSEVAAEVWQDESSEIDGKQ